MIKVSGLTKSYRKKLAVDNLSFNVESGRVTGFLGPNGSGKSTTMRLMLGLDYGSGDVTYDNKHLHEYQDASRMVGLLIEAKAFAPNRTALNHLKVLAIAGNIPTKRAHEVLELVGLTDVANKRPGKFSLGMSQRLGIAAAILGSPKYLLLDEPANGLDPEGIAWLRNFLEDYAKQGNGVFISSHLLSELSQMVDNVVVIGKGKMIANTSIKELLVNKGSSAIFLRVSNDAKIRSAMTDSGVEFSEKSGGFLIAGAKTDRIGKLAFEAGVAVLELSSEQASLEDVFLELTSGAQEYQTRQAGVKK